MSPCVEEIDIQQQGIDTLEDFIKFLEKQGSDSNGNN